MKRVFVDANVFLRFFTQDDRRQQAIAAELLQDGADGKLQLVTGPPVLFEIAWTLRSAYRLGRERTLEVLGAIATLTGLEMTDAAVVHAALALAKEKGGEFSDAYIAASSAGLQAESVASFNTKDFRKLGTPLYSLTGRAK
jgi:predicted nucleic acid-binding protein